MKNSIPKLITPNYGRMYLFEQPESVAYSPYLLAFIHEGDECRNPFISECGRFEADPVKDYGFVVIDTGGGCEALCVDTDDGRELWITDPSGCYTPDTTKKPIRGILGLRIGGQTVAWVDLLDIPLVGDTNEMTEIMDMANAVFEKIDQEFDGSDHEEALCRIIREANIRIVKGAANL